MPLENGISLILSIKAIKCLEILSGVVLACFPLLQPSSWDWVFYKGKRHGSSRLAGPHNVPCHGGWHHTVAVKVGKNELWWAGTCRGKSSVELSHLITTWFWENWSSLLKKTLVPPRGSISQHCHIEKLCLSVNLVGTYSNCSKNLYEKTN
jgi:hypothetical protein